jgi:arylformamidase
MHIVDITAPLDGKGPYWPGSSGYALHADSHVGYGDSVTNSTLRMDVHAGTHVDAPAHHLSGGVTVEALALENMIGPVEVVEIPPDAPAITAELAEAALQGARPERVIFKTRNSSVWELDQRYFDPSFVGLTFDGASWLAGIGLRLVGVDYLSVQRFGDSDDTHKVLYRAGAVVLEGLNLSGTRPGNYRMVCLPMLLIGAEAAPARVILIQDEEDR